VTATFFVCGRDVSVPRGARSGGRRPPGTGSGTALTHAIELGTTDDAAVSSREIKWRRTHW
jgi:hypothetical protein